MDFTYEFHHEGFFGYSIEKSFHYFSFWHFLPIIVLIAAVYLTYRYRDKIASWKGEETFRYVIAAILILNEAFYYWRLLYVGNADNGKQLLSKLPLQVCEWMGYISAFMLMKKSRNLFDICFYICLTLGLIPLFTPTVINHTGPTYARYYQFWIEHIVPIFAVFYMIFVHGMKPDYRKVWKPFALLAFIAVFAIIANINIPYANFMYLQAKTEGDSIANLLPENIWIRLVLFTGILIVLFTLLSLPQIIKEIKAKKAATACADCESDGVDAVEKTDKAE